MPEITLPAPKTFLNVNKQTIHNKDQSYWTQMAFLSTVHDLFLTFFDRIHPIKKISNIIPLLGNIKSQALYFRVSGA